MQRHAFLSAQSWLSVVEDSQLIDVLMRDDHDGDRTTTSTTSTTISARVGAASSSELFEMTARLFKGIGTLFTNVGRLAITPASKEQFLYFSPRVPLDVNQSKYELKDPTELVSRISICVYLSFLIS